MPHSAKPVAVYLRVSTADQDHASQRDEVTDWLDRQGVDPGMVGWYVDTASGRTTSRREYDRLKRDAAAGKVKRVVVFSLDRLGRDVFEGMELVAQWGRVGVAISSVTQAVDIGGGPIGAAIAVLLFAFAEIGWAQRRDAQRAGTERAKAAGVYTGRKPGAISRQAAAAGGKARAAELKAKGLKLTEVAAAMGVTKRTVIRYLKVPD